jgi:hypothetical protein
MYNLLARANALFAFSLTVVGILAFGLYLSTFIYDQNTNVKIDSSRILV